MQVHEGLHLYLDIFAASLTWGLIYKLSMCKTGPKRDLSYFPHTLIDGVVIYEKKFGGIMCVPVSTNMYEHFVDMEDWQQRF